MPQPSQSASRARLGRREFLQGAAAAAFSFNLLPATARGANSRVQVACIGVTGKGNTDTLATAAAGGVVVALCDVANPRGTNLARNKKKSKTSILMTLSWNGKNPRRDQRPIPVGVVRPRLCPKTLDLVSSRSDPNPGPLGGGPR